MTVAVASAVLVAALLHASWNAILRFTNDRMANLALLTGFPGLVALFGTFVVPLSARASWPWLAASVLLHLGYNSFLGAAYKYGELGKVYPLARGTAPLITLLAGYFLIGEELSAHAVLGILLVGLGIVALTFERGWRVLMEAPKGVMFALITSLFISAYSVTDGLGARAAGNAYSYIFWLFALDGLPLALFVFATRGRRTVEAVRANWLTGCIAGLLSMGAYSIVIWAMTRAPIALVAALRETSVVFAVTIGVLFLGEKFSLPRAASVLVVLAGLALMRL